MIGLVLEDCQSCWPSVRHLSSLGSSWRMICLEHQLIENEHHRSLMLISSLCTLARAPPPVVGAWFPVPSFAFPALASSALTMPVLIASWFRIQHRFYSSFPRAFVLLKMFPKHSLSLGHLLLLDSALFEQLGCPLGSCYCSRCRSLLELCCFALHSLLVACLCLYMQANDTPNLLCTFLLLSGVLQQSLLDRAQASCFVAAVAWVFLPLEGEQSVARGPLVCWVPLNLQLFCSQSLF